MEVQETAVQSDRVLTIPNALSFLRLLGVPVFLWLVLVPRADGWAVVVLVIAGITDYLDGKLARRWQQITRLGQLLDPIADRLYILATLVGLLLRGIIPWWLVALIVGRDLVLAVYMAILKRHGIMGLPVHFIGKAATFNLLYAFPLILLGDAQTTFGLVARVLGWAFAVWGTGLYLWAGVLYIEQANRILRHSSAR
ncbi:MAG: CDP-alcohol phosphatidyltransferase family protein [Candidatus Nanopelagicales bacterium]|nr:CDP-alcohol phosphatidyltransferase family protein [Candidatus Nanopelagicales bacterium]